MFVAWRDLRFARGRFALITAVVMLITLLVGFLSGLTGGLAGQNISAVLGWKADRVVLSAPAAGTGSGGSSGPTFADSTITAAQQRVWSQTAGVTSATPVGITQSRLTHGDTQAAVSLFGSTDDGVSAGHLVLPQKVADDLGVTTGSDVTLGGRAYTVSSIGGDEWYSHTPVVRMAATDWQQLQASQGGSKDTIGTALLVRGSGVDWAAADSAAHTKAMSTLQSLNAIGSFRSEIGSLGLIVALLFGISALVVGAFFTVWTMQRSGDVAVLKALGASTRSLLKDALGQAFVVLLIGVGLGMALVVGLGLLAGKALPFLLSPLTTAVPALLLILLGLAGAAFALRSVTSADPLTALGSHR